MSIRMLRGDCRDVLATLPDESVHCVVTSPPYWGLRDYGTAKWEGGDVGCDHRSPTMRDGRNEGRAMLSGSAATNSAQLLLAARTGCGKCGARRIDSQIGLEPSFHDYIETMTAVFREVRRVLRRDGTLWLNMGDSYGATSGDIFIRGSAGKPAKNPAATKSAAIAASAISAGNMARETGLRPKNLIGIPWRLAFALQADGWYLRSDIIWAKPNPMPESVTDRPTKAHEYLFLMTKSERYYYDAEAIKEDSTGQQGAAAEFFRKTGNRQGRIVGDGVPSGNEAAYSGREDNGTRNRRTVWKINGTCWLSEHLSCPPTNGPCCFDNKDSVWEIPTSPFPEAHFATFPPALVEPCILAGCPERCCAKCGAPWVREPSCSCNGHFEEIDGPEDWISRETGERKKVRVYVPNDNSPPPVPGIVIDPFGGAGTTGLVADRLGRNAILIELNPQYAEMAERRLNNDAGMFSQVAAE